MTRYNRMLRFFETRMPQSFNLRYPVQSVVPLLLLFFTQTEIVAEHGLERFSFPMLKVTNARQANRPERSSNFFHVRALSPDRERKHLNNHLPQGFITLVYQPA